MLNRKSKFNKHCLTQLLYNTIGQVVETDDQYMGPVRTTFNITIRCETFLPPVQDTLRSVSSINQ